MRRLTIILLLAALVTIALAAGDTRFTSDGGMNLTGYTEVELVAYDGAATVTFIDSSDTTVVRTHYLRDSVPRSFSFRPPYDGIDSLGVDLDTASEVIATPR